MAEQVDGMKDRIEDGELRHFAHELGASLSRDLLLAEAEHVDPLDLGKRAQRPELRDRTEATPVSGGPEEVRGEVQDPHSSDSFHYVLSAHEGGR